jgi:hypothetical protein
MAKGSKKRAGKPSGKDAAKDPAKDTVRTGPTKPGRSRSRRVAEEALPPDLPTLPGRPPGQRLYDVPFS